MNDNDTQALSNRAIAMVDTIAASLMSAVEVAAEKLQLACDVARVTQRLTAFSAVLEAVGVQKAAIAEKMADAKGSARTLYEQQIRMLEAQEVAILKRVGVPDEVATKAIEVKAVETDTPTHRRDGRRFAPVNGSTKN